MALDADVVRLAMGRNLATVVTLMPDGQPQALPAWIDTDGEHLLVNTELQRQRTKNVSRDPRVTVLIRSGDELSRKYVGTEVPRCRIGPQGRIILKIAANKVTTPASFFSSPQWIRHQ